MKLTFMGTLFGVELPPTIKELYLGDGRVFKNPLAAGEDFQRSPGANITLYKDVNGQRQFDRDVAKYLVDIEVESESGRLQGDEWGISLSGSGGVTVTGRAALGVFSGLVREELERVVFPLRLGTKARIIMIPVKVQGGDRDTVSQSGLDLAMIEPYGVSLLAELAEQDCDFLAKLAKEISRVDLSRYQVPVEIFRDSFYKNNPIERGLDLITCLESLFSQSPGDIRFKLAFRTSFLLDFGKTTPHETFVFIKEAYKHRSNLVHGRRDKRSDARKWFVKNMEELEGIVRRALFITIELKRKGVNLSEENIDRYVLTDVLSGSFAELHNKVKSVGKLIESHKLI